MRYTYKEAMKEMEAFVEKMQQTFPEDAYKIQCSWESILEYIDSLEEDEIDDRYTEGYDNGYRKGYDKGWEDGYEERYSGGE